MPLSLVSPASAGALEAQVRQELSERLLSLSFGAFSECLSQLLRSMGYGLPITFTSTGRHVQARHHLRLAREGSVTSE